jgi:hypothetical protein
LLNPVLYKELCRVFDTSDITVGNLDQLGVYACPKYKVPRYVKKRPKPYAEVDSWGETYHLRCPVCRDHAKRLYFSHLFRSYVKANGDKGTRYRCGNLYRCQNEHCNLSEYIHKMDIKALEKVCVSTKPPEATSRIVSWESSLLPPEARPIVDISVPFEARDYLRERGYDIQHLYKHYNVMYVPEGSPYHRQEEPEEGDPPVKPPSVFREDRILIPIIQGGKTVSWQARAIGDHPKKYLFPTGCRKSQYLYNLDTALHYDGIVIVEGLTDVWSVGPDSVALLGKSMSPYQLHILKTVWSFYGFATVLLDADAYPEAQKIARVLSNDETAFPRGVRAARVPKGDPGDYTDEEIGGFIEEAWSV